MEKIKTQSCCLPSKNISFNAWANKLPTPYNLNDALKADEKWEELKTINNFKIKDKFLVLRGHKHIFK